jgi:hypothetical membrane protein
MSQREMAARAGSGATVTPTDRWLALGGLLGPIVFIVTFTIAGALRPGYSPIDQAVSDLGVGDRAWVLNASLVFLGLSLAGFAISFYRFVRRLAGRPLRLVTAALLMAVGVGFAVAGIFPETNSLHWLVGAPLTFVGAPLGFLLAGLILRRDPGLRGWATATLLASLAVVVLTAVTFATFSSYTPSAAGPEMVGQSGGLAERILFVAILAWYAAFGWHLFRAQGPAQGA